MLKWLFGKRAEPVTTDVNEIYKRFDLNNDKFKKEPHIHATVLAQFDQVYSRGGLFGPGKVFYSDPTKKLIIKAAGKKFRDEPDYDDEEYCRSSCVAFTEQKLGRKKKSFALIIREDSKDFEALYNSVIFGIYGHYDEEGKMVVKKILAPSKDDANRLQPPSFLPITPETVRGALRYAELCAKAIYKNEHFYPRSFLDRSKEYNLV